MSFLRKLFAPKGDIHDLARRGDSETVRVLLKYYPDLVNAKNDNGWTPLLYAADCDHLEVATLLLANGAEVNVSGKLYGRNDYRTPLHLAARDRNARLMELLLIHNADVNAADDQGETPLHATVEGSFRVLQADRSEKPFGEAMAELVRRELTAAELLLAHKANINARNNDGRTPLHHAVHPGGVEQAQLLLANKADIHAKDKDGETPLHWAVRFSEVSGPWELRYVDLGTTKLLLAKGADINAKAQYGRTPLHFAVICNLFSAAELLLANKADVNAKDDDGRSPLYWAADVCKRYVSGDDMMKLLCQHGGRK